MLMCPVQSTNLIAIGYDEIFGTLRIRFKNGTYDYYNVPSHIYNGLLTASSHGSYFAKYIKNSYPYKKL